MKQENEKFTMPLSNLFQWLLALTASSFDHLSGWTLLT